MQSKKLVSLLLAAALSFSAMGCGSTGNLQEENKTEEDAAQEQSIDTSGTDVSDSQPVTDEGEEVYRMNGQEAELQEALEWDGVTWVVSSMEITKELGNRPQDAFHFWGESLDDAGNLTGDESYLFITVSCKNSSGSQQEVLLNSNGFVVMDEAGRLFETGSEARYISKKQEGNDSLDKIFHYVLKDGEETGLIEIGYIIEDSFVSGYDSLYYCVGIQGSQLGNPDNRYIKVDVKND